MVNHRYLGNGTYGICKDRNNKAYDPRNANLICVNGQLLLLDLIEKLEQNVPSFELIQSNTDGLIIKCKKHDFEKVDDTCYEWESRTKMNLEFDYIKEIYQGDVNNYVFIQFDGKPIQPSSCLSFKDDCWRNMVRTES